MTERLVDQEWAVKFCLKVMEDLDHLEQHGTFRKEVPEWARKLGSELRTHTAGAVVLMTAYEKCAKAFRAELLTTTAWRGRSLNA